MRPYQLSFLIILLFISATPPNGSIRLDHNLTLHYTASPEVLPHFQKGLLLLHNFEYADAKEAFEIAQQTDPDFVMSYWGEAMTYDHPVWGDLNIEKARAALQKLGKSPQERESKAKTELEKDFIAGLNILFGDGSKPDRERSYSAHMAKLFQKYPGNHEVAAFYCLSLFAIKKGWNEWEEQNIKAAEIAQEILKEDPNHPGALHYLVHADDHPEHAKDGLAAADKYAKVASYAGHALHMPSHIYLALGMWDDVVRSNEVAWQASLDRVKRKKLDNDALSYHAHLWLMYGYLQQGRFQKAKQLLADQLRMTNELSSSIARVHLIYMKGHYLFQTNEWNSSEAAISVKTDDVDQSSDYINRFIDGYKAYQEKNAKALGNIIDNFESDLNKSAVLLKENENIPICGVTRFAKAAPTEYSIRMGNRFVNELKGLSAWLKKDLKEAEKWFKEALPKEGSVVIGPPMFIIPPHELYGNFLLAANRPQEAYEQFQKALRASPNRMLGLKGQLIAARAMKDKQNETLVKDQLLRNLKDSDSVVKKNL